uniref:transcription factor GTE7-like n=1 Tax=Erigeron canadensis TaxID=72917 RepID=UPI001CB92789|nr:transcription factor GTE7-like [Erigeron canadensis]
MASTVLASRNQTSYNNHHRSLMGEIPNYTNSNRNLNPNPNPNQKPKSSNKKKHHFSTNGGGGRVQNHEIIVSQGAASDDAYSYNQRLPPNEAINGFNQLVTYNVAACSRNEINELRKKLVSDLGRIRNLNDRIQGGEFNVNVTNPNGKFKKLSGNKRMAGTTSFGSGNNKQLIRQQGLVGNLNNINNNINSNNNNGEGDEGLMKMCRQILTKLLKHKSSWVFKVPVDAVKMGLHDYHQIIKRPMDLGTVKSNITKGLYGNPLDFAADVRLVFENAMLYNPRTDEVHKMADSLLRHFEELFRPIQEKLSVVSNHHLNEFSAVDELDGSSWDDIPTPDRSKKAKTGGGFAPVPAPPPPAVSNKQNNHSTASNAIIPPPVVQSPVRTPSPTQPAEPVKPSSTTTRAYAKLPKPKAKDPNKREMNMEEKQRLGLGLQSLPPEKMPQLLQIIKKRNDRLAQEGDEIELDIEALDTETLWELDRFVTNWKKADSKAKRQALLVNSASTAVGPSVSADIDDVPMVEKTDGGGMKKNKREAGEEDVDIGDEMPESSFPHVEIEKDDGVGVGHHIQAAPIHGNDNAGGNASSSSSGSSSSSSGDSSSSSDSDSGSSSGSDSDADEAQS